MSLILQIETDLKEALRNQDTGLLSVLRLLKSSIKNAEIAKGGELLESEVLSVLEKQAKQRKDSVTAYINGNRPELAEGEKKELEIIERYLPTKLSREETEKLVEKVIADLGASSVSEMGQVIKEVMSRANGQTEGSVVSQLVREKLL